MLVAGTQKYKVNHRWKKRIEAIKSPSNEKMHSLGGKFALLTIITLVRDQN